jgi:hypothetical protein
MFWIKVKKMSRLVRRPVQVTTKDEFPDTIIDGDRQYMVSAIIDWWIESGTWWEDEPPRTLYRIQTTEYFVFDLEFSGGKWSIYRVWD